MGKKSGKGAKSATASAAAFVPSGGTPVIAFYGERDAPYGVFSNFHRHTTPFLFTLPSFAGRDGFPQSVWCPFSEKAIMITKAALMNDLETFQTLDEATTPADAKALGRQVKNFDLGMKVSDPRVQDLARWQGRNVLGNALMRARDAIRKRIAVDSSSMTAGASTAYGSGRARQV
mmetsp:Transcript_51149/g.164224  ORF Transcript_51149/g.164224 Transcript_51149/m.164224 type:complete len:175 (+) Transcript_51149:83-607(+)